MRGAKREKGKKEDRALLDTPVRKSELAVPCELLTCSGVKTMTHPQHLGSPQWAALDQGQGQGQPGVPIPS